MTLPCSLDSRCGERVHVLLDQLLELEHDAGAALRVGRGPGGLGGLGGIDRLLEVGGGAEADLGLDLALVGVEHVALPLARSEGGTADEMVDAAKHGYASSIVRGIGMAAPLDPDGREFQLAGYWSLATFAR